MTQQSIARTEGQDFDALERRVTGFAWRPVLEVEQVPSPQRIAPRSVALAADLVVSDRELGSGRLVLLHDPSAPEAWQGTLRLVVHARAAIEGEIAADPLLGGVAWSWLRDALERGGARYTAASGTVTSMTNHGFGDLADRPVDSELEVRASWTPLLDEQHGIEAHLAAWQELIATMGGVPEAPQGVVMMGRRAGRGR